MNSKITKVFFFLRGRIVRITKPNKNYSLYPISTKFGLDRGTAIDRIYIEKFLNENSKFIKGRCLEIHDNFYTKRFGGRKVTKSDILDIDKRNKEANIHADLKNLKNIIRDDTYDCFILTHTLGLIDEYEKAVSESQRILKPGGTLLVTLAAINRVSDLEHNYWRFTKASAKYVFGKYFEGKKLNVQSYGNVLAAQAFIVGMSAQDLKEKELSFNDPHYPIVIAVKAQK